MRVDVSEIKCRRECSRKWALSSRNYYHMKPKTESPNLRFGSIFHEGLAGLYLSGGDQSKIDATIDRSVQLLEGDIDLQKTMANMLTGYSVNVLPADLERYDVLDIEHKFCFSLPEDLIGPGEEWARELEVCGSIDMILLDKQTNCIVGFEHKSCKNFRTEFYNVMDEQPRTYYIALGRYIEKYNKAKGTSYKNGGIYVNETRKLKTRFEHSRLDAILYTDEECRKFLEGFKRTAEQIYFAPKQYSSQLPAPEPSYLKCNMCDFRSVCEHYGYRAPAKQDILEEFAEEVEIREFDHLDEKVQRSGETEDAVPPEYAVEG